MVPSGDLVEPRRYHASVILQDNLIVYGGLGMNDNYLNDFNILSLGNIFD
jgi:hypothetical protein